VVENQYFADAIGLTEELLFVFPIINLVSLPSKSVKQAAIDLLSTTEKLLVHLSVATQQHQKSILSHLCEADVIGTHCALPIRSSLVFVFFLCCSVHLTIKKQEKFIQTCLS